MGEGSEIYGGERQLKGEITKTFSRESFEKEERSRDALGDEC
jgi:hypothetical protein